MKNNTIALFVQYFAIGFLFSFNQSNWKKSSEPKMGVILKKIITPTYSRSILTHCVHYLVEKISNVNYFWHKKSIRKTENKKIIENSEYLSIKKISKNFIFVIDLMGKIKTKTLK